MVGEQPGNHGAAANKINKQARHLPSQGGYMGFVDEFVTFLNKHKVVGLAVAFIIGAAAAKLVSALVNDIIMPIIAVLIPGGDWRSFVLQLGPVKLLVGDFTGALIDFVIVAFVIFMIVKYIVKDEAK
jgi:large conductance mechanosensitive channel